MFRWVERDSQDLGGGEEDFVHAFFEVDAEVGVEGHSTVGGSA